MLRALLAFIALLLAAVVFSPGGPSGTVWASRLHDFAHGPIFGCVAIAVLWALRRDQASRWRDYALAFAVAAVLGVATEWLQAFTGRDPSYSDVRSDLLGALSFLALHAAYEQRNASRSLCLLMASLGVVGLAVIAAPITRAGYEYARRAAQFPVLADFSIRFDRYFIWSRLTRTTYEALPAALQRTPGERAMHVGFGVQREAGVDLHEPIADWSAFEHLLIDVANPTDAPLDLVVRVHDRAHNYEFADRYNERFVLRPHTREVLRIPLARIAAAPQGRAMDLREVSGLILFRAQPVGARWMYVSRIWLE